MGRAFTCRTIPLIPMLILLKKRLNYSILSYAVHPVPSLLRYLMNILLNKIDTVFRVSVCVHTCPYLYDYVCACSHRIQGRGLDPLELGLLVVSYSIWVLGNALGSSGLPSQDALINSINVFTFLFWYALFLQKSHIIQISLRFLCS